MGTISDKLNKLIETKDDLKAALAEKGQTVGDVFSEYPDAVRAISGSEPVEFVTVTVNKSGFEMIYVRENGSICPINPSDGEVISRIMKGSEMKLPYGTLPFNYTISPSQNVTGTGIVEGIDGGNFYKILGDITIDGT